MPSSHSTPSPGPWFSQLAAALDRRSAARLALLFVGAVLARGRRTVTSWIRAAGLSADYKRIYTTVAAAGKRAEAILQAVGDRFALEIAFRDCKEVVGAGQQQVRFVWASVGAFHVCLWTFTLTEAWAWDRPAKAVVDRAASPWDDASRRPSHADKRRAWRLELLREEIRTTLPAGQSDDEFQAVAERLLRLAA
jgi:hypothetical protein